jgi:hypothetical protein
MMVRIMRIINKIPKHFLIIIEMVFHKSTWRVRRARWLSCLFSMTIFCTYNIVSEPAKNYESVPFSIKTKLYIFLSCCHCVGCGERRIESRRMADNSSWLFILWHEPVLLAVVTVICYAMFLSGQSLQQFMYLASWLYAWNIFLSSSLATMLISIVFFNRVCVSHLVMCRHPDAQSYRSCKVSALI